ncbi:MAG: hypothetical protein GF411_12375 [Candidatus Lokiarchaeota archaeon]|nr:hypothetical protein [Candidatus Lokiarchaeota archaeon]
MSNGFNKWIAALAIIFMGFAFPAVLVYLSAFYAFNIWFTAIFSFLSLGGAVGIISIVMVGTNYMGGSDSSTEKQKMLRAQMIETLKEMDEVIFYLSDIRDFLKTEE